MHQSGSEDLLWAGHLYSQQWVQSNLKRKESRAVQSVRLDLNLSRVMLQQNGTAFVQNNIFKQSTKYFFHIV